MGGHFQSCELEKKDYSKKEGKTRYIERSQDKTWESPDDIFGFKPKPSGGSFPVLEDHVLPQRLIIQTPPSQVFLGKADFRCLDSKDSN